MTLHTRNEQKGQEISLQSFRSNPCIPHPFQQLSLPFVFFPYLSFSPLFCTAFYYGSNFFTVLTTTGRARRKDWEGCRESFFCCSYCGAERGPSRSLKNILIASYIRLHRNDCLIPVHRPCTSSHPVGFYFYLPCSSN